MELRSPASVNEAITWLAASTPTISTDANEALRREASLYRTFATGQRSPDTTWAIIDGGAPAGVVAGRQMADGFRLLDMFAADAATAPPLLAAAAEWARQADEAEASFGAPVEWAEHAETNRLIEQLTQAGFRLLVTRQHYQLTAASLAGGAHPLPAGVTLERGAEGDEGRLAALMQLIAADSLDVRDRSTFAKHGDGTGRVLAAELLDADPIDCARFAVQGGRDAGVVIWHGFDDGRGFVAFVGVAPHARGQGLAAGLVATATADLIAGGSTTLIADTDDVNVPMRRAFAKVGWHATEARIDLELA